MCERVSTLGATAILLAHIELIPHPRGRGFHRCVGRGLRRQPSDVLEETGVAFVMPRVASL